MPISAAVTIRACAFAGKLEAVSITLASDGAVLVFDSVACHYTRCHSLTADAVKRARKVLKAAESR